ncbi:MAG: hypothetical protein KDM91_09315 [Verrucomicrobiae bacterium]|nr:hypothetical protein [Verrucomicrobiae bacterium]
MSHEFLTDENTAAGENPPGNKGENRRRSAMGGGCAKLLVLMTACGVMSIVLIYLVIDMTNSGEKAKNTALELIRAAREPAPAPSPTPAPVPDAEPRIVERVVEKEKIVKVEVPVEVKAPLPSRFVPARTIDTTELWTGLNVRSTLTTAEGAHATAEKEKEDSYLIDLTLNIRVPKANRSLEELSGLNAHLPKMLPALGRMVETSSVSPFYHALYAAKTKRVQERVTRLDRVLSRHNFFDCETVLELTHPDTGKRALLMQGEMDVVSDGSDGDRWPDLDDYVSMSANYRYSTSYAWPKQTPVPNPLLARFEAELAEKEARFAVKGLSIEENRTLRERIDELKTAVGEVKARSFLIAEADPFIVMPLSMLGRTGETPFGPAIGDYAVVIFEDKAYPAIVGDAGPSFQMGEASLRMAKALNEKAGVYSRPVSDLTVTYLVFPQSGDKPWGAPDLERWRARCQELIDGLGGLGEGYALHPWEDLIARKRAAKSPPPPPPPPPRPRGEEGGCGCRSWPYQ